MYNQNRKWKKIIYPPTVLLCVLSLLGAIALPLIFSIEIQDTIMASMVYVLSAYSLFAWVVRLIGFVQKGKSHLRRYKTYNRYVTDTELKAEVSLYLSLSINLLYSTYEAVSGLLYHSIWFGTVAFYYMILSLERFLLLKYIRKKNCPTINLYRRYRFCGVLLIALNVSVCAMSILIICNGETAVYPGHMIYAVAGYSFYNVIMASVNVVKYHKRSNPVYAASKVVSFSTALFSMFSLQNAMIAEFGNDKIFQKMMNITTGSVVFLLLMFSSIFMIYRGNRMIRQEKTTIHKSQSYHDKIADGDLNGSSLY